MKKLNNKGTYSLACLALSILFFLSWITSFWVDLAVKAPLLNNFDWFMFSAFRWVWALLDIAYFGPLILGFGFFAFSIYFAALNGRNKQ